MTTATKSRILPMQFRSDITWAVEDVLALSAIRAGGAISFEELGELVHKILTKVFNKAVDAGFTQQNADVLTDEFKEIGMCVEDSDISRRGTELGMKLRPNSKVVHPVILPTEEIRVMVLDNAIADLKVRFVGLVGGAQQKLSDFDVLAKVTMEVWNNYIPDRPVHNKEELRYELSRVHGEELEVLRDNLK